MPNRLALEKNPYLLQHKDNPVDWRPWNEEAFAAARQSDRPLLLSIGYATCHWCHVMERESFSDPKIAALMNDRFICVKLDREERPDVDKIYMTAVQAMAGQGGWPLNVFLTPQLKPFFGGTYFPPGARWGRPGWAELLERISELWATRRPDIETDAERLTQSVRGYVCRESEKGLKPSQSLLVAADLAVAEAFDAQLGGFSPAPKFPMPAIQRFLLHRRASVGDATAKSMAVETLRAMCRGGIFDQIGGGFHRYSTDAQWRVPHFEKMLYDNAQLLENLADAVLATGDTELRRALNHTAEYLRRDLRGEHGGFFSAEDADSVPAELAGDGSGGSHQHAQEGAFYVWTEAEIQQALGAQAAAFCRRYDIVSDGNALADPNDELRGKNIPYDRMPNELHEAQSESARDRLRSIRDRRPRPQRDDKCLASWNGLALSGFSRAFIATGDAALLSLAEGAADFLRREMTGGDGRALWHRWRDGECAVSGMADDYAYVACGLCDLYEAGFDPERLAWAVDLTEAALARFAAPGGGLFQTAVGDAKELFARPLEDHDGVEPSASAVLAGVALRLHSLTGAAKFRDYADATIERFSALAAERPMSMSYFLSILDRALIGTKSVLVAGSNLPGGSELLAVARSGLQPNLVTAAFTSATHKRLSEIVPVAAAIHLRARAAAYVCISGACGLPIEDPALLQRVLSSER